MDTEAKIASMLSDACGGAVTGEPNTSEWGAVRYAEHVRDRQAAIVEFIFEAMPDAEDLGGAYGDSFDAVEGALRRLAHRSAILDRLVEAGYITESLIDDIEAKLEAATSEFG